MNNILIVCFFSFSIFACGQPKTNVKSATMQSNTESKDVVIDTNWAEKVVKSDAEWKAQLSPKAYYILREQGTERPFSSELNKVKEPGVFICAGCSNPLFSTDTKFDSGTGWPSFFKPYSKNSLHVHVDNSLGMSRDALTCKRCDGHLGHVFNDGPKPTGLRYCIDGDGMFFVATKAQNQGKNSVATFAGGCFWCTETIFESIKGVNEVISGYSGGKEPNPTYENVGAGRTGHAEAFEVHYDSTVISYPQLLRVFFASIDPTIVNGQGPDRGKQYRTIAFYRNDVEKKLIEVKIKEIANEYDQPIATQVVPFEKFWEAEAYHQDFVKRNPNQGYVRAESIPRRTRTLAKVKDLVKKNN